MNSEVLIEGINLYLVSVEKVTYEENNMEPSNLLMDGLNIFGLNIVGINKNIIYDYHRIVNQPEINKIYKRLDRALCSSIFDSTFITSSKMYKLVQIFTFETKKYLSFLDFHLVIKVADGKISSTIIKTVITLYHSKNARININELPKITRKSSCNIIYFTRPCFL